jgi:organic hydroperoxide reductase OsmC/OhrA
MSEYHATVSWTRQGAVFSDNRYSRAHSWAFDGGLTVAASSSPHVVPAPLSNAANVDPEEAYVAAIASCHMLFFLNLAAKQKFVVDTYEDNAIGEMTKGADGKIWMSRIRLRPNIIFSGPAQPTAAEIGGLHHQSHAQCYLANSVKTEIVVEKY